MTNDRELCYVICPGLGYAVRAWLPIPCGDVIQVSYLNRLQRVWNYSLDVTHKETDGLFIEIPDSEALPLALQEMLAENLAYTLGWTLDVYSSIIYANAGRRAKR